MKILQIAKYYPPVHGGIETVVADITEGLNDLHVSCDVICSHTKNKYFKERIKKYTVYRTKTIGHILSTAISLQFITKLRSIIKNYDLIHFHHPNPMGTIALFFAPSSKIVVHWHSDIIKQRIALFFFKPLQNWLLKKSAVIIVTSPNYLNSSVHLEKFKSKAVVIPIGINPNKYQSLTTDTRTLTPGNKIIFSLGRLIYYKGFEHLIRSANYLDDSYTVYIGGSGPLRSKLERIINKEGLHEKVILLGRLSNKEISEMFRACNVFCLPSIEKTEAFGVVLLEAMAFCKPLITTKIIGSGLSWVNQHNLTGLVVPPKNAKQIAWAIQEICDNTSLYQTYSENSRKRLKQLFLKKDMIEKIANLYKKV